MEGDRPTGDLPLEAPAAEVAAASGGGGPRFCGRGGGALAAAGADLLMVNFEMIVNQKWLGVIDKKKNLRCYMNTFSLLVFIQMQMLKLLRMPLQKEKAGSQRWQNLRSWILENFNIMGVCLLWNLRFFLSILLEREPQ